jgi:hypothetical protein
MLRKIVFTLALLFCLAMCNYALAAVDWSTTVVWHNSTADQNWFNAGNWVNNGGQPNGIIPPDVNTWTVIEPYPGPRIDGDAVCSGLGVAYWAWSNSPSMAVEVDSGTLAAGEVIGLSAGDNYAGEDPNGFGSAGLTVRGGTVTTPLASGNAGSGLIIGGGGSTYSPTNVGKVKMYGGDINVPRIALQHGDIALYGGTLECSRPGNFVFFQNYSTNRIDISGGTLKLAGDYSSTSLYDPNMVSLIANGRIVSMRGTLGTPVFDGNYTTLTSSGNIMTGTWGPTPVNNATEIHYRDRASDVNVGITLAWNDGDINILNHQVYLGTSSANVTAATKASAEFMGEVNEANSEPNSFVIGDINHPYNFALNTSYYWRVDANVATSNIYDGNSAVIGYNTTNSKGSVWTFKTHNGLAYSPKPINGAGVLSEPLQLSWKAGDLAASTNGHKVYFTTELNGGNLANSAFPRPTDSRYRGLQSGTTYSLANLAGVVSLVSGTTYYWCVDEVNGSTTWKGPLWKFTPADYITIEDFEDYNSFADVNANWGTNYAIPSCWLGSFSQYTSVIQTSGHLSFGVDAAGKHGRFYYNAVPFSEMKRNYPGGTVFTGNSVLAVQPAALRVDYIGATVNAVDEIYNRMYVAIEDTAGNVGVYENPDGNAALATAWTPWYSALKDINSTGYPSVVQLKAVSNFYLGFGLRCLPGNDQGFGGDGNVMFDNIRLYSKTCNPGFAKTTGGLTADFDGDCDVDINDLLAFANNWLWAAIPTHTIPGIYAPHNGPAVWYKLNEGTGSTVIDYGPGTYTVDVCNTGDVVWSTGRDGNACINFNTTPSQNTRIAVPVAAFDFMNDDAHYNNTGNGGSISISVWIDANNADAAGIQMFSGWSSLVSVWDASWNELIESEVPRPFSSPGINFAMKPVGGTNVGLYSGTLPANYFGGRWNHWAFVKDNNNLIAYCNGVEIVRNTTATIPFFKLPIGTFRIGMRGGLFTNWGKWSGQMQDFKVWDYALDGNEVAYEATDGTGVVGLIPLDSVANLKPSGNPNTEIIDFQDMSIMGDQWHKQILWP